MADGRLSENELVKDREDVEVQCSVCSLHPDDYIIEYHYDGDMVSPECGLVVGDR